MATYFNNFMRERMLRSRVIDGVAYSYGNTGASQLENKDDDNAARCHAPSVSFRGIYSASQ